MQRLISLTVVVLLLAVSLPVSAQDGGTHTVSFDGVSFTYDAALGTHVIIEQTPGDPLDSTGPSRPQPPYTDFLVFSTEGIPILFSAPLGVRVYRTADMLPYTRYQSRADQFAALLAERSDLNAYMEYDSPMLPALPTFSSRQVFRSRVHYLDGPAIEGIAFLAVHSQRDYPFLGTNFDYVFQGFSTDGAYYVSIWARLNTDLFPQQLPMNFDLVGWADDISTYYAESQETLNNATPGDFAPSLDVLDAVVTSFAFEQ